MPVELIAFGLGALGLFGAVIWFGLSASNKAKQLALDETVEVERAHLEQAWPALPSGRRVWRLVITDDATHITQVVHDEQRSPRATFVVGPLARFACELQFGAERFEVVVQARGTKYRGAVGGQYSTSIVVLQGERVVFEAVPWHHEKQVGMRAFTREGVLDVQWEAGLGAATRGTVLLDGVLVGEVLSQTSGAFKRLVSFDSKVPEALLPWVFVIVWAGRYERLGTVERSTLEGISAKSQSVRT